MRIGIPKYLLKGQLKKSYNGARDLRKLRRVWRASARNETFMQRIKAGTRKNFAAKCKVSPNPGEKKTGFFRRLLSFGRSGKG